MFLFILLNIFIAYSYFSVMMRIELVGSYMAAIFNLMT